MNDVVPGKCSACVVDHLRYRHGAYRGVDTNPDALIDQRLHRRQSAFAARGVDHTERVTRRLVKSGEDGEPSHVVGGERELVAARDDAEAALRGARGNERRHDGQSALGEFAARPALDGDALDEWSDALVRVVGGERVWTSCRVELVGAGPLANAAKGLEVTRQVLVLV